MSEIYAKDLVLTSKGDTGNSLSNMMKAIHSMLLDVFNVLNDETLSNRYHNDQIKFVPLDNLSDIPVLNIHHKHKGINYVCIFDKDSTLDDLQAFLNEQHDIVAIEKIIEGEDANILYHKRMVNLKQCPLIFPKIFEISNHKDIGHIGIIIFNNNLFGHIIGKKIHYGLYFSKLQKDLVPILKSLKNYDIFSI
ncbi:MAG: hypothetical protein GQ477_05310 [Nanohaloarchaea archaeon]|nr:hypothetical protein [Candidatus Nanohaloarchaea archaeon]